MDPYVLALQLYLFNKACGGLPLRVAEQIVVSGVVNVTCWTARTIGSGVLWLVRPKHTSTSTTAHTTNNIVNINTQQQDQPLVKCQEDIIAISLDLENEFEIITPDQIKELENTNNHNKTNSL